LNGKFKTLVFNGCTLLFNKKAGCSSFLAGNSPVNNLINPIPYSNFKAAVFFVTEKYSRFFALKIKKKGWMHHEKRIAKPAFH